MSDMHDEDAKRRAAEAFKQATASINKLIDSFAEFSTSIQKTTTRIIAAVRCPFFSDTLAGCADIEESPDTPIIIEQSR